jgi:hypothetical protein
MTCMSALGHVWTAPWQELSDVAAAGAQRMKPLDSSGLSPASDKVCTVVGTAKPNAAASPRSFDDPIVALIAS